MDLSLMLKSLEGDFQEEDEERTGHVEGSACAKAQRRETDGTPGGVAGGSFSWRKGLGRPMEGALGGNARLQMAWYPSLGNLNLNF